jgi:hypothetical protein
MRALTCLALIAGVATLPASARQTPAVRDLQAGEFDTMLHGVQKNSATGFSVAVGDINGDRVADIVIGAVASDSPLAGKTNDTGAVFVYLGRKELAKTVDLSREADLVLYGASKGDQLGFAVALADLNGDGLGDVVMGAPLADGRIGGKANDAGVTYVYFGRAAFAQKAIDVGTGADLELHSSTAREYSGSALAAADVNGDGVDDLVIGAPFADTPADDAGVVYVVCGSKALAKRTALAQSACTSVRGIAAGDRLGLALAAGDVTGDGTGDLILGALETDAPGADNAGQVTVMAGRRDLPASLRLASDSQFRFRGSAAGEYVGQALSAGDVNGDGIADLVIGAAYADVPSSTAGANRPDETDAGKVLVFYGGAALTGDRQLKDGADVVLTGAQGGTNFGDFAGGVVAAGDLTGDDIADLVIAAPLADVTGRTRSDPEQMKDVGAIFVRRGARDLRGTIALPAGADQALYGATKNDFFGGVALTKRRKSDALFGMMNPNAYRKGWMSLVYDRFFSKALAVGDINGDGVGDLVAGAPAADGGTGQKIDDAGAVFVMFGRR